MQGEKIYVERKTAKTTKVWMNKKSMYSCPGYEDGFPRPGSQVACVTEFRAVAPNVRLFLVWDMAPRIVKLLLDF